MLMKKSVCDWPRTTCIPFSTHDPNLPPCSHLPHHSCQTGRSNPRLFFYQQFKCVSPHFVRFRWHIAQRHVIVVLSLSLLKRTSREFSRSISHANQHSGESADSRQSTANKTKKRNSKYFGCCAARQSTTNQFSEIIFFLFFLFSLSLEAFSICSTRFQATHSNQVWNGRKQSTTFRHFSLTLSILSTFLPTRKTDPQVVAPFAIENEFAAKNGKKNRRTKANNEKNGRITKRADSKREENDDLLKNPKTTSYSRYSIRNGIACVETMFRSLSTMSRHNQLLFMSLLVLLLSFHRFRCWLADVDVGASSFTKQNRKLCVAVLLRFFRNFFVLSMLLVNCNLFISALLFHSLRSVACTGTLPIPNSTTAKTTLSLTHSPHFTAICNAHYSTISS